MKSNLGWKRLVENIFSLSVFQFASYGISFVMMPYLIQTLGIDGYGKIIYSFAIVSLVGLVVEYGFEIAATKAVSVNRYQLNDIGDYISAVYIIKIFFLLIGFSFLLILTSFNSFSEYRDLIILSYVFVIAKAITPLWFLQGLEEMKIVAVVNIITRMLYFVAVLLLIKHPDQLELVPLLNGISALVTGIYCLWYGLAFKGMSFARVSISKINEVVVDGFNIFISQISIASLTHIVPFVLGFTSGSMAVGIYSAAEKIVQAVFGLYVPFQQSFFPWITAHLKNEHLVGIKVLKRSIALLAIAMTVVGLLLHMFSEFIMALVTGESNPRSVEVFELLAFMPLLLCLNTFIGVQVLISLGKSKIYSRIVALSLPIGMALLFILTPYLEEFGAAISIMLTEAIVFLMLLRLGVKELKYGRGSE